MEFTFLRRNKSDFFCSGAEISILVFCYHSLIFLNCLIINLHEQKRSQAETNGTDCNLTVKPFINTSDWSYSARTSPAPTYSAPQSLADSLNNCARCWQSNRLNVGVQFRLLRERLTDRWPAPLSEPHPPTQHSRTEQSPAEPQSHARRDVIKTTKIFHNRFNSDYI